MRKITHFIIYSLLLVMAGCEKDTEPANFAPRLTTGEVLGIFRTGATLSGEINQPDGVVVKEYGILYSALQSMAEYEKIVAETVNDGKFSAQLTELEAGKTYYYCAYASSGYSIAKGEVKSFLTVPSEVPVFSTLLIDDIDEKSFVVNTSILDEGGSEIAIKGFCWKEISDENTEEPKMSDESKNLNAFDEYQWRVNDLKPGRKYAVRAYAVNGNGLGYGTTAYVHTKSTDRPVVSSCTPSDSTSTSIRMMARILANASSVTEKGFCYSATKELPEVTDMRSISNVPDTVIFATVGDLLPGNTYYIRAYATGSQGTGYGDVFSYTIPNGGDSEPGIYSAGHFNSPVGGILGDGSYVEYGDSEDGALRAVINCVNTGDITGTIAGNICGALGLNSTMSGCTYGGTVNGVPGIEANAVGRDERASSTNKPDTGDIVSPDKQ